MAENILITGGAGFIGSNLSLKLLKLGYNITVLDNLNPQIHGENVENSYTYNLIKNKVHFIHGSINNIDDIKKSIKDVDVIVHLASETGTGQSMYSINEYVDTNITGTSKILDVLANNANNVRKILLSSSRSIYGEGKYKCEEHGNVYPGARSEKDMLEGDFSVKCPICNETVEMLHTDENSKQHPSSIYGYTKLAQEHLVNIVCNSIGLPYTILRFQNVYGPGQSLKNPYTGILSIFSTAIKNNNNINIFEDGLETRDFVYIDDVVDALIESITNEKSNNEIFNVGSGVATDVLTIAKTLKDKYRSDIEINISGNFRLGDIRHNVADLSKIQEKLNYTPKVPFEKGLTNFVNWVEEQEIVEDQYSKSLEEMKNKGLFK